MRYAILLCPLLLTGCVPFFAGYVGGSMSDNNDALEYYLTANEVEPRIRKAMRNGRVVKGMTKKEVRLVMDSRQQFTAGPQEKQTAENEEVWQYLYEQDRKQEAVQVIFQESSVIRVNDPYRGESRREPVMQAGTITKALVITSALVGIGVAVY